MGSKRAKHKARKESKKKKPKPAEVAYQLRKDIKTLKRMPDDFRMLDVHGVHWFEYLRLLPKKAKEAEAWAHGVVLCFPQPSSNDITEQLEGTPVLEFPTKETKLTWQLLMNVCKYAQAKGCSFVYLGREEDICVVNAMNILANRFGFSIRFKRCSHKVV